MRSGDLVESIHTLHVFGISWPPSSSTISTWRSWRSQRKFSEMTGSFY